MNAYEEELRRLTVLKARLRILIDTTRNKKKKEIYRKKHEEISARLNAHLQIKNLI